jgi:hypothetical protein
LSTSSSPDEPIERVTHRVKVRARGEVADRSPAGLRVSVCYPVPRACLAVATGRALTVGMGRPSRAGTLAP